MSYIVCEDVFFFLLVFDTTGAPSIFFKFFCFLLLLLMLPPLQILHGRIKLFYILSLFILYTLPVS